MGAPSPPTPTLPHQGGGSLASPSPTRGEGALLLPPPPGGREPCFSLPHQGGGSLASPSPLVGEGWGGGEGKKCPISPCPVEQRPGNSVDGAPQRRSPL